MLNVYTRPIAWNCIQLKKKANHLFPLWTISVVFWFLPLCCGFCHLVVTFAALLRFLSLCCDFCRSASSFVVLLWLLHLFEPCRPLYLRFSNQNLLQIQKTHYKTRGDGAFKLLLPAYGTTSLCQYNKSTTLSVLTVRSGCFKSEELLVYLFLLLLSFIYIFLSAICAWL